MTRFKTLDGLRGICALSVVLYHCADFFKPGRILSHGYLAVDMFFILSGFVISHRYERALKEGMTAGAFLGARVRRLMPTYWLGTIINLAIFTALIWMVPQILGVYGAPLLYVKVAITAFLLIPNLSDPADLSFPVNKPGWSLFGEWAANGLYALGLFRLKTQTLALLTWCLWLTMAVVSFYSGRGWDVGAFAKEVIPLALLRSVPSFLAGVLLYRAYEAKLFERLPIINVDILMLLWFVAAVLPTPTGGTPLIDSVLVMLVFPLLVALLVRAQGQHRSWFAPMGELSYPLYASHFQIIVAATYTPLFGLSHGPRPVMAVLVVAITIAIGWAVGWFTARSRSTGRLPSKLTTWMRLIPRATVA